MKKVVQDLTSGGLLGVWGKWMKHAKYIYNIQDFNPEQVLAVGYTKSKLITDAMMWFDKFSCKRSDLVITVGRDLVETVENRFKDKKVKKYQAAERCVCSDGRARGLFQFYGASRTGRYSGRNIQLQNLPQNHISTLDEARELVKLGCFDMVETIYGNTPDVLSQLIRTMLIPKEGCEFIVADFSAIEARVLAWEAGEDWRLEAFLEGKDIYCASASQMFHVPVVKHGINGELRQKGKVAELACGYPKWRVQSKSHRKKVGNSLWQRKQSLWMRIFLSRCRTRNRVVHQERTLKKGQSSFGSFCS